MSRTLIDSLEASRPAMAFAAGIIIGIIDRANSTHTGFSFETMLLSCGPTPPRRTASVKFSKLFLSSGRRRKLAIVPRYAGDRLLRNVADSGTSWYVLSDLASSLLTVRQSHRIRAPRSD